MTLGWVIAGTIGQVLLAYMLFLLGVFGFSAVGNTHRPTPFDFSVLRFEHHLNEEHFSLLVNQLVTIFSILWPFDRHIEASCFCYIDLICYFGVDSQR